MKTKLAFGAIAAVVAVGALLLFMRPRGDTDTYDYEGYRIPKDQLRIADPHPGCEYTHYHAVDVDAVSATDGTVLIDTSDCGFGPVQ